MTLRESTQARLRVLLMVVLVFGALGIFLWTRVRQTQPKPPDEVATTSSPLPTPASTSSYSPSPTPSQAPETIATPAAEPGLTTSSSPNDQQLSGSYVGKLSLIVPVAGVRSDQLLDTFTDARSEGRSHDAIDIPAPAGTAVLAAADGQIVKLFQSDRGGTTVYQLTPDKKLVLYYAHLQSYADGVVVDKFVRQGEVIAYVGDTGNAGVGNYHLHFSIAVLSDPKRYWEGTNINPYPLLRK